MAEDTDDCRGEAHLRRAFTQRESDSMARPRKYPLVEGSADMEPEDDPQAEAPAEDVQITYTPGEGDPAKVAWGGHTFFANVPKTIPGDHVIVDLARSNRFFHVGDFDPSQAVTVEETPLPKTSDQYRAHAVKWVTSVQSVDELDRKWSGEETLRIECGVGLDDIEYLATIFAPIRGELRKRDQAA